MEPQIPSTHANFAVISPSSAAMSLFPKRVENGQNFFQKQGYHLQYAQHAFERTSYMAGSLDQRVNDLMICFLDSKLEGIIASIGGYNSNQLLNHLDYVRIAANPKIFCGYSDITALLLSIYVKTGLTVFHGPTYLPEFCEYPAPFSYTWDYFMSAIRGEAIEWQEPPGCTIEFCDWLEQEKKMATRMLQPCDKWKLLRTGQVEGKLIGGNVSTIMNILGTEYLPVSAFNRSILFIEEIAHSLSKFDSLLYGLKHYGVFEQISGLVVGRFEKDHMYGSETERTIEDVILEVTREYNFPILIDVDLGHTDPMITIPIGRKGYLSCENGGKTRFGVYATTN